MKAGALHWHSQWQSSISNPRVLNNWWMHKIAIDCISMGSGITDHNLITELSSQGLLQLRSAGPQLSWLRWASQGHPSYQLVSRVSCSVHSLLDVYGSLVGFNHLQYISVLFNDLMRLISSNTHLINQWAPFNAISAAPRCEKDLGVLVW